MNEPEWTNFLQKDHVQAVAHHRYKDSWNNKLVCYIELILTFLQGQSTKNSAQKIQGIHLTLHLKTT